ncbi:MAG: LapA family protein [Kitasatospora sp.]|nr:LapA family protein [Kitasatospora sp.]
MADKSNSADRPPSVTVGGRDVRIRTIAFAVLGVLAVWFIAVNTASVKIRLWIPTVTLPLWLVLAGTLLVGAALGWLLARRRAKG